MNRPHTDDKYTQYIGDTYGTHPHAGYAPSADEEHLETLYAPSADEEHLETLYAPSADNAKKVHLDARYAPYTDGELEEKYHGQMDDTRDPQYAYEYGMMLYEIYRRHYIDNTDYVGLILYWLKRYNSQVQTQPECVKRSRYIITKLLSEYPELREN